MRSLYQVFEDYLKSFNTKNEHTVNQSNFQFITEIIKQIKNCCGNLKKKLLRWFKMLNIIS